MDRESEALAERAAAYAAVRRDIDAGGGLLDGISLGHRYFGFTAADGGVWYREWAPAARGLWLTGDFNNWDRRSYPMAADPAGNWSVFLPIAPEQLHGSKVKVRVWGADGSERERIPAYAQWVVQDENQDFAAVVWLPPAFEWKHPVAGGVVERRHEPSVDYRREGGGLRIYEAHVGMASEEGRVATYAEFERDMLPRVAGLGYNAVQLMAIQEHPYYGSFGYHVSSFFAPSSRFGTPEDLKRLIDAAHGLGLSVLMDLVHSHAVKNLNEGLNQFDGSGHQYFYPGGRGQHAAWDSVVFDYGRGEVRQFLLSNIRYWLEEFRFDGFRFDGVTSMLYHGRGLGQTFGHHDGYFGDGVDRDAVTYLQLANDLAHFVNLDAVTVAEDVSGMPKIARPTAEGGIGFDYRLAMGIPDFWIRTLKERTDESWQLGEIWYELLNRRHDEKHVGYAESHDQALVGDKTIAFWLMDAAMYSDMALGHESLVVDRGVALHKIIRLLTFSLAGEAWLSFMGNEFGHPEWIDFPREGNGWSYHFARRQWSLADSPFLRYQGLNEFDRALMGLDRTYNLLSDPFIEQLFLHEDMKLLVYRRGPLVFAVNLHPTESYPDLRIPVPDPADYVAVLSTDEAQFAGHGRAIKGTEHLWQDAHFAGRHQSIQLYLPARVALVLAPT
jgi:1,4-alpha-glucan branching enzyme